ncbi:Alpha-L-arabinofuranosidase 1 [Hordeum vulgare]|nr:Alpha-L-arabinofuranosidase 1 [Hordeum vulgare]
MGHGVWSPRPKCQATWRLAENIVAMRMRSHGANDLPYDVRYEPYIARLGLLPFVLQFKRNPPPVNHAALTALTDHWRPKTHSFHLACGEMTMTLEDMAMISGLPLNGDAVTGHLDQASMRIRESSSLCGFVWSFSVWMWERFPVGRPMLKNPDNTNPNPHEELHDKDPYRRPTIAYHWDQVSVYTSSSRVRYKCYVNELDTLTTEQVFWRPYEEDREYNLNQLCTRDSNIWRSRCPMICFYAAEFHFVDRVATQFGKRQENRPHNDYAYQKYLVCYGLKLKPDLALKLINPIIEPGEVFPNVNGIHLVLAGELHDHHVIGVESTLHHPLALEDLLLHCFEPRLHASSLLRPLNITDVQHPLAHLDRLRVFQHFREGREFLMCVNGANVALSHPRGGASSEKILRTTLEKFKARFHKWAAMLSFHGAQSMDVFTPSTRHSSRARRRHLTIDDIEEEEQIEEETTHEHEVDIDAPQPSQPSQSRKKKTPRAAGKKRLNSRICSPEYNRKLLPKGMRYAEEDQDEEEEDEEDVEDEEEEEESSEEEEEEVPTRKGKATKRGRRK